VYFNTILKIGESIVKESRNKKQKSGGRLNLDCEPWFANH
jgi:hypothetical protein